MCTVIAASVCWVLCDLPLPPPHTHTDTVFFGAVVTGMGWQDEGVLVGIQWEAWLRRRRQHFLVAPLAPINAGTVI